jgi:hypothetical protein
VEHLSAVCWSGLQILDACFFWNFQRGQQGKRGSDQVLFSKGVAPLEWCYVEEFLEMPTLHKAVDILEFGFAVLCPRLLHHSVSACLIPAMDEDNALEMMFWPNGTVWSDWRASAPR